MKQFQIIDGLLTNSNKIEQMGRTATNPDIYKIFGEKAQVICGQIVKDFQYLYIYNEPFVLQGLMMPADAIVLSDGSTIYLYKIEY